MAGGTNGVGQASVRLEVLTDLPDLPPLPIPDAQETVPGEGGGGAFGQQLEPTPAENPEAVELAAGLVELTDGLVAWAAYGPEWDRPVARPAAQARVAAALVRVAGHLGPVGGTAAAAIPEPVFDAASLVVFSLLAWGPAFVVIIRNWRDARAKAGQGEDWDGTPGGGPGVDSGGQTPGRGPGGDTGRPPGPGAPGPVGSDLGSLLSALDARQGRTESGRN